MEIAHLDLCHFDPIVPLHGSEPTITAKHNQGGTIC